MGQSIKFIIRLRMQCLRLNNKFETRSKCQTRIESYIFLSNELFGGSKFSFDRALEYENEKCVIENQAKRSEKKTKYKQT